MKKKDSLTPLKDHPDLTNNEGESSQKKTKKISILRTTLAPITAVSEKNKLNFDETNIDFELSSSRRNSHEIIKSATKDSNVHDKQENKFKVPINPRSTAVSFGLNTTFADLNRGSILKRPGHLRGLSEGNRGSQDALIPPKKSIGAWKKIKLLKIKLKFMKGQTRTSRYDSRAVNPALLIYYKNRNRVFTALKHREPFVILDYLLENLHRGFSYKNLDYVGETILLIGDFFMGSGDMKNAIFAFNHFRILSDERSDFPMKIQALINLAECCKILKRYEEAMRLLKKGLQIAWAIKEENLELLIYDKLGLIHFCLGNMIKAFSYHERCITSAVESHLSPNKISAIEKIANHLKLKLNKDDVKINSAFLQRLGINAYYDQSDNLVIKQKAEFLALEDNSNMFYKRPGKNKSIIEFSTHITVETQLEQIFQEREFFYECLSPKYPESVNPHMLYENKVEINSETSDKKKIILFHNKMSLADIKRAHIGNIRITDKLDPIFLKVPLDEKIKLREIHFQTKSAQSEARARSIQIRNKDNPKRMFTHVTPNRSSEGFNYFFKPIRRDLKEYYEHIKAFEIKKKNAI